MITINYDTIKATARHNGLTIADLCALSPKNDPFYTGRPAELKAAEWFAGLYHQFQYGTGVHLRRIHYRIVSQETAIERPDGQPYHNTDKDWNYLNEASKWARYLGLVSAGSFVDRRNPEAIIHAIYRDPDDWLYLDPTPRYDVVDTTAEELELYNIPALPALPELPANLPELPGFRVDGYDGIGQPYHVEVWCEKTTMNDVLEPLCQDYGCNLVTGAGEMSITSCINFLRRVERADKPARILYISDFDPAGLGMPISVARKLEYFQRNEGYDQLDIRLHPICLTSEQVQTFTLPRVPVKDSDLRKANFEANHGTGQVELDALESLYPGELRDLVKTEILRYYDPELPYQARQVWHELNGRLGDEASEVEDDHSQELDSLNDSYAETLVEYEQLRQQFSQFVQPYQEQVNRWNERLQVVKDDVSHLYGKLLAQMETVKIDLDDFALPDANLEPEPDDMLYISGRDYVEQLTSYKSYREGVSDEQE